jgi:TonB family protein
MHEAVSDVLIQRAHVEEGLGRTLTVSIALHVSLLVALAVIPREWRTSIVRHEAPMMISLGGPAGPNTGGMTPISGRPIQEVAPPMAKPQPVAPPAAKPPEMVMPQEKAPKTRTTPAAKAVPEAHGRTPTRGAEVRPGTAVAETGAQGAGFGLQAGGGSGTGGYLDVGNFCCPEYLETMRQLIQQNWNSQQAVSGHVQMKFTIRRDGTLVDIEQEQSSGYFALDAAAQRALLLTKRLPPLPNAFTEDHLTVHLVFQYGH